MRVAIIGQGYVGETAASCFAEAGHRVTGIENQPRRLATLQAGKTPLYEPGLAELLGKHVASGRLDFAQTEAEIAEPLDAVLISVGSPSTPSGAANLEYVRQAMHQVLALRPQPKLIVVTSTIPPGTSDQLLDEFAAIDPTLRERFVHNPVFFNQGKAIEDWQHPARLIFGTHNPALEPQLRELYRGIETPVMMVRPSSAELVKYGANTFLATKFSFANQLTPLCDVYGADIDDVLAGMAADPRIGPEMLTAGLGFGDSCLQKDSKALRFAAERVGETVPIVAEAFAINERQRALPVDIVLRHLGDEIGSKKIAILGLSNEPISDDMRAAPSLPIVKRLSELAGEVAVWDPLLSAETQNELFPGAVKYPSIDDAVRGADIAIILTEYGEVIAADWPALAATMNEPRIVIDGRNCLPRELLHSDALHYIGIGRPRVSDQGVVTSSATTGAVSEGNPYFGHVTDMWKHLPLVNVLALEHPAHVCETHSGSATYELPAGDSDPGRAYGLRHFLNASAAHPTLSVSRFRQQLLEGRNDEYPGSPALAMRELGSRASYTFCDLSTASLANVRTEAARLGLTQQVTCVRADGLNELWHRAATVPNPGDVLVHIDPFEPKDAPHGIASPQLAAKLGDLGFKVVFWYPFADPADKGRMEAQIRAFARSGHGIWSGEITMAGADRGARFPVSEKTGKGALAGCGIVAINLSSQSIEALDALGRGLAATYNGALLPTGGDGSLEFSASLPPKAYERASQASLSGNGSQEQPADRGSVAG